MIHNWVEGIILRDIEKERNSRFNLSFIQVLDKLSLLLSIVVFVPLAKGEVILSLPRSVTTNIHCTNPITLTVYSMTPLPLNSVGEINPCIHPQTSETGLKFHSYTNPISLYSSFIIFLAVKNMCVFSRTEMTRFHLRSSIAGRDPDLIFIPWRLGFNFSCANLGTRSSC